MIKKLYQQFVNLFKQVNSIYAETKNSSKKTDFELYSYKSTKVNLGNIQSKLNSHKTSYENLSELEFQVFSQFGDDGIIQWLINYLEIPNKTFVEFGVEKYIEANTRFLLFNNNWDGYVMDGSQENINYIKNDIASVFFNLQPKCAFITKDNINQLISESGFDSEIGLLSIDIDGNDYWVWNALDTIKPIIVIVEYNAEFGLNPWTINYKEDFVWEKENSVYFWGCSLQSFCDLADSKGYSFIGCNSHGNNAYFVRNDNMKNLKKLTCNEGFKKAKFSLARKQNGEQYSDIEKYNMLKGKEIFNTVTNKVEIIS